MQLRKHLTLFLFFPLLLGAADSQPERDQLMKKIDMLARKTTNASASHQTFTFVPDDRGVSVVVTLEQRDRDGKLNSQAFSMPGQYQFLRKVGGLVEMRDQAKEYWTIGEYDNSVAAALADALTHLNSLLARQAAQAKTQNQEDSKK